ncbi:MAG: AAA family ATPase [Actinomycetota bacterium]|nr:AAA family ATPase [Actinomycetota bacterium]
MRLGVAGKGGVGKTTISAVLARLLARRGYRVVAIDCDSDPNLAANIGLGSDQVALVRPILDQRGSTRSLPVELGARSLIQAYGHAGPDDVTLMLAARAERAGSG